MGYCASMVDSSFHIAAEDKQKALVAAKGMKEHYHWVSQGDIQGSRTLEELLDTWGYDVEVDDEGNIKDISFNSEKLGDEAKMFEVIAPFVKSGSFIEMQGEDGALWRWTFKNGEMKEITPTIEWNDE